LSYDIHPVWANHGKVSKVQAPRLEFNGTTKIG
jgi:hypothetical protein